MRNMILTLCLLPLCSSLVGAQLRTDRDMVGLKGPVKTVKIETIEISQADMKPINRPSWIREVVTTFDEKGYKAEEELFNPPGALFRKMLFKCDAKREK